MNILKKCFSKTLYFRRMELKLNQEKMAEKCCLSPRQYTDLDSNTIRVEKTYWDKLTIIILLILTSDNGNNGRILDECYYIEFNN